MDGILVINKPAGMTSHDVVNFLRRHYHQKKFGHTGTLDRCNGCIIGSMWEVLQAFTIFKGYR